MADDEDIYFNKENKQRWSQLTRPPARQLVFLPAYFPQAASQPASEAGKQTGWLAGWQAG